MAGRNAWLAAALLPLAVQASAQSVNDFRLQPASPTPGNRPAGPTDRDAPVVRTATPAATPAAPTAAAPAPKAQSAAKPSLSPSPTSSRSPSPKPTPEPEASTEASESPPPQPPAASSEPVPDPTHTHFATAMPEAEGSGSAAWWWALLPAAALALAAAWLAARRKDAVQEDETGAPDEDALLVAPWGGEPLPPPPPPPPPPSLLEPEPFSFTLEPVRMTATIVSTLFAYRLTVTNVTGKRLGRASLAGGMIGAHASLPLDEQLGTDGQPLELLHELPPLTAGESLVVEGEMRLPLNLIDPIHAGEALLFVPIVRFRIESGKAQVHAAFVVGEAPAAQGAAVLPFRIDLGPRVWSQVSARKLDL